MLFRGLPSQKLELSPPSLLAELTAAFGSRETCTATAVLLSPAQLKSINDHQLLHPYISWSRVRFRSIDYYPHLHLCAVRNQTPLHPSSSTRQDYLDLLLSCSRLAASIQPAVSQTKLGVFIARTYTIDAAVAALNLALFEPLPTC